MGSSLDLPLSYSPKKKKKKKKGLIITLSIIGGLILILGVVALINLNNIMIFFGKGKINVAAVSKIETSLKSGGAYQDVSESTSSDGTKTITAVSTDKAVKLTVTQNKDGTQVISGTVDAKMIPDVNKVDISNLQSVKSTADKYLNSFISPDQVTAIEAYVAKEAYSQYQKNKTDIVVDNNFNGVQVSITGNTDTGEATFNIQNSK